MSNTKTKMKSGTIAIIALSIVLVLSLVTTITLAYFTASRNVVTTVRFANGVTLQMTGVAFKSDNSQDTPPSNTAADLYWTATGGGSMSTRTGSGTEQDPYNYGGYTDVNAHLAFDDMGVRAVDSPAYIAVKLTVTAVRHNLASNDANYNVDLSNLNGYTPPAFTADWADYTGHTGWKVYTVSSAAAALSNNYVGSTVSGSTGTPVTSQNYGDTENAADAYKLIFTTGYALPTNDTYMNDFAGITFTFTVNVVASDTEAGLAAMAV